MRLFINAVRYLQVVIRLWDRMGYRISAKEDQALCLHVISFDRTSIRDSDITLVYIFGLTRVDCMHVH
jgi:hypothetical protein